MELGERATAAAIPAYHTSTILTSTPRAGQTEGRPPPLNTAPIAEYYPRPTRPPNRLARMFAAELGRGKRIYDLDPFGLNSLVEIFCV